MSYNCESGTSEFNIVEVKMQQVNLPGNLFPTSSAMWKTFNRGANKQQLYNPVSQKENQPILMSSQQWTRTAPPRPTLLCMNDTTYICTHSSTALNKTPKVSVVGGTIKTAVSKENTEPKSFSLIANHLRGAHWLVVKQTSSGTLASIPLQIGRQPKQVWHVTVSTPKNSTNQSCSPCIQITEIPHNHARESVDD